MSPLSLERFQPPGPGQWAADPSHHARPVTALYSYGLGGIQRGQEAGSARYGMLVAGSRIAIVEGFVYGQPNHVVTRPPGDDGSARSYFDAYVPTDPDLLARFAAADHALQSGLWETDLLHWDTVAKPFLMGTVRKLAAVDPAALDVAGLSAHFEECLHHYRTANYFHHVMNPVDIVPIGELQLRLQEWAGLGPENVVPLLQGYSPASAGWEPEMETLADALHHDERAAALLDGPEQSAPDRLRQLRSMPGVIGERTEALIATAGYRTMAGFDVMDLYALELPAAFLGRIKTALNGPPPRSGDEAVVAVRDAIPAQHFDEFDRLLERARRFARVKDERGLYANFPAGGLVRRAVLEAGRRAAADGVLAAAADAADAAREELRAYFSGRESLPGDALAERRTYRESHTLDEAPLVLGRPHEAPVPVEWLPSASAHLARLGRLQGRAMFGPGRTEHPNALANELRGSGVGAGCYTGRACLVLGPQDFEKVGAGDVIVAAATNPGYSVVLGLARAVVTEHGGPLSHAAIVARELGIPAVVGCRGATTAINDGQQVTVDADNGVVRRA